MICSKCVFAIENTSVSKLNRGPSFCALVNKTTGTFVQNLIIFDIRRSRTCETMYWIKNSSVFALVKHYMYFLQLLIFCQTENAYDFFLIICEGIFL